MRHLRGKGRALRVSEGRQPGRNPTVRTRDAGRVPGRLPFHPLSFYPPAGALARSLSRSRRRGRLGKLEDGRTKGPGRGSTMSEEGFLEAVAEVPEDDTPRLVYADWLE